MRLEVRSAFDGNSDAPALHGLPEEAKEINMSEPRNPLLCQLGWHKSILELMVGRYGFAVRIGNGGKVVSGSRSSWWLLRPDLKHVNGPFGTRQMARRLLGIPNWPGEREWGAEAAREALRG